MRMNRRVVTWIGSWMFSSSPLVSGGAASPSFDIAFRGIEFVVGEVDIEGSAVRGSETVILTYIL